MVNRGAGVEVHAERVPRSETALLAACVAVFVWGIGPLFITAIGLSGVTVATYRLWFGAPVMYAILRIQGGRLTWRVLRIAAPAGAMFAADIAFGFSSFRHTSIVNATLIGSLSPLLVLAVSGPLFGERLRRVDLVWFAAALAGTAVVVFAGPAGGTSSRLGDLLAVGSVFTWTGYFLSMKRHRSDGVPAFAFMTGVIACGAVAITPYALVVADPPSALHGADWVWLFAMILGPGALGHGLMTWASRYANVNVTSLLQLAGPVVSTVGAAICFGQRVSIGQVLGGTVVLAAIGMVVAGHRSGGDADYLP